MAFSAAHSKPGFLFTSTNISIAGAFFLGQTLALDKGLKSFKPGKCSERVSDCAGGSMRMYHLSQSLSTCKLMHLCEVRS